MVDKSPAVKIEAPGFWTLLLLLLLLLIGPKLAGVINWSWWAVLAIVWVPCVGAVLFVAAYVAVGMYRHYRAQK